MTRITAMILLFLIAIFQLFCNRIEKEKFFSGIIEYDYSYTSDSLNTDSLAKERPAKGIFRYDQENYQSSFTGKDTLTYYYSGSLNKCVEKPVQNRAINVKIIVSRLIRFFRLDIMILTKE